MQTKIKEPIKLCILASFFSFFLFWLVNKNFVENIRKEKKQIPLYTGSVQGKQKSTKNYKNLQNLKQRVCQDHSKQSSIQTKKEGKCASTQW